MISLIVCSINSELFNNFENSLAETIGLPYEVIRVDNTGNKYSICQAYNTGAEKTRYEYLCFAHEDIIFHTPNWGQQLTAHFETQPQAGLIGVAGAKYKSLSPGGWMTGDAGLDCYNLYQYYPADERSYMQANNPEQGNSLVEVKVLDGVFLFTKKEVWQANKFDEHTFCGFHGYDLDYCMQIGQRYKLFVCTDFILEHFSSGSSDRKWIENTIMLSNKWRLKLPAGDLPFEQKKKLEWAQKRLFFLWMRNYKEPFVKRLRVFLGYGYFRYFNLKGNLLFIEEIAKSIGKKLGRKGE